MSGGIRIASLDLCDPETAREVHRVQQLADAREAALLGLRRFPPLERTPEDLPAWQW